jgi:hypothetical protein
MIRNVENNDLVGKTIVSIDASATNVLKLNFSDGTSIELVAEIAVSTPFGQIPGIFVDKP